jgi:Holliday junction DNA helicase RuvA
MIGYLQGTVFHTDESSLILLSEGGVGYRVLAPKPTLETLAVGDAATFWVYTHVREDALVLFGFASLAEQTMFELLISVSGVGPKSALGILSLVDIPTIQTAVVSREVSLLTAGKVGKKTAEKIIVELQNKVTMTEHLGTKGVRDQQESLEALVALGYSVGESREALKAVPASVTDVGERIKSALRSLGR